MSNPIFKRVSVRDYRDMPVEEEKIEKLLRAAMAAPSAGNQQPWEFIVVDDKETLDKLAETSPYAKPIGKAPLSIVMLLKSEGLRFPIMAEQDMGACAENILLQATKLGLGAVWQGFYPIEERCTQADEILGIPEGVTTFAIISIGYPCKKVPDQKDRFDETRVHRNRY